MKRGRASDVSLLLVMLAISAAAGGTDEPRDLVCGPANDASCQQRGQSLFKLIGITNASAGDASVTPSADFAAQPEVDNRWFRGYRRTLSAGAEVEIRRPR